VTQSSDYQGTRRVALVTGAAHRIGAHIVRLLHAEGVDIALHYRHSVEAARDLQGELQRQRPDSVLLVRGDLHRVADFPEMIAAVVRWRARLDLLVNNASAFYPTPLDAASETQWDDLMASNLKGPFFLAREAATLLRASRGCIVNLVDIHAERPLKDHPIYSIAKAGNAMMVKALARELGPQVRVNGIAPGAILWPDNAMGEAQKREILDRTALGRPGEPDDIARTLLFLFRDAHYVTGQILAVDGGRSVQQ
jgi:pteridine reductase